MATVSVNITGNNASLLAAVKAAEAALGRLPAASDAANKSLGNITKTGKDIQNSLGAIRLDAIVNLGRTAVGAVAQLARLSDEAQNLRGRILGLVDSGNQVGSWFTRITDISSRTGVSLDGTSEAFQKIALATKPLGYNIDQAASATETLNKLLTMTGTSGPAAASAMYQIGQALGRGTVAYEDLKQLQESAAPVLAKIAEQFGMTAQQFLKEVQAYKIGSGDIMRALANMKGEVDNSFGQMPVTFSRASNALRNSFIKALDDLEQQTGIFSKLAEGITYLSQNLDKVVPLVAAFAAAWIGFKVAGVVAYVVELGLALGIMAINATRATTAVGLMSALRGGLPGLIAGVVALGAGYLAFDKVSDVMKGLDEDSRRAKNDIDATTSSTKKLTDAARILKAEGPLLDLKALNSASEDFIKQYELISGMVGMSGLRLEQEQAIAQFAKQQLTTYEKIKGTQAAQNIRNAMGASQVGKRAQELGSGTPTQMEADYAVTQKAIQAMRDSGRYKQQELDDLEVLQNKAKLDRILSQEQGAAEARMKMAGVTNQGIIDAVKTQMEQVKMAQQGGVVGVQGVLGALDTVYSAMGTKSKAAFETHKKLATAQALISTYQAAAMAIAAPPGPPWSFIYVAGAIAAGMAQISAINSQQFSGRALGGPVMGNQSYIVGERGPEIFTPSTSGGITRNQDIGGGGGANINFTIQANDAQGFDDLLIQRRGMITQIIRDAMAEQGQRSRM